LLHQLVCDAEGQQTIRSQRASAAFLHRLAGIKDVDHRASLADFTGAASDRRISLEGSRDIDEGISRHIHVGVAEIVLQLLPSLLFLCRRHARPRERRDGRCQQNYRACAQNPLT
jgi:hypothetical protein